MPPLTQHNTHYHTIIIGAGGAGLMCAMVAGQRGRRVLLLDHAEKAGKKILISGGGRCNFTNVGARSECYISANKHFCKSTFGRFTQHDFVRLVEKHGITYHEKTLGQLFCDDSAQQIVDMFLKECAAAGVQLRLNCSIHQVAKTENLFSVATSQGTFTADSLVVATGGLSIPKMGATNFGYKLAHQFNIPVVETAPALVPFTFTPDDLAFYEGLSGISFDAVVRCGKVSFRENVLITHRGVSGPAILQISSYWKQGESVHIHILPDVDWPATLKAARDTSPKKELRTVLADLLPKRFVDRLAERGTLPHKLLGDVSNHDIHQLNALLTDYTIKPNGTEGYRKAEVTLGGVATSALNAATMETRSTPGLYFIGEVVDVTGWLGGYNFQWAWSSGFVAGQSV